MTEHLDFWLNDSFMKRNKAKLELPVYFANCECFCVYVKKTTVLGEKKNSLQHPEFPSGHPPQYFPGPTLLNFGDRTSSGAFSVVWS